MIIWGSHPIAKLLKQSKREINVVSIISSLSKSVNVEKKPKINLDLSQKKEMLEKLENGMSMSDVASNYGISYATVCRLRKGKEKFEADLEKFSQYDSLTSRKKLKAPNNQILDRAVYTWFVQKRNQDCSPNGTMLSKVAIVFDQKIREANQKSAPNDSKEAIESGNSTFKASSGWVRNFKQRYGIKEADLKADKQYAFYEAAEEFAKNFPNLMKDFKDAYSLGEFGLAYRELPKKSPESERYDFEVNSIYFNHVF